MVAPVRWATPGTEVVCAHQPACSAMSTIQSASTPPPWPPMARTAILIGEAARGAAEVLMLLSMSEPQSASCARRARRRCRKPITARARGPGTLSPPVGLWTMSAR